MLLALAHLVSALCPPRTPPLTSGPAFLPLAHPAAASWRYDYQVDPQGPEQKFLDAVRDPHAQNWV